jgi:hypothetical protein
MSFALLAAAIPGALQLGQTLINKPKREDFRPNTAGMEKYISYLRGRTAKSEVAHQTMQPQLRAIGAQNRQTERKIQSAVGRGNLSASEEAQLQISQGQAATAATQAVGEQATALQTQENRRIGEQVAQAQARIAQAKEQGNLDFERATKDYKNNIKGSLLNIGGSVASAGIGDYLTKQATSKSAFDAYKAAGLSEFGSAEELAKASTDLGIGDSRQLVNMKLNEQKVKSAFSGFSPEEISAAGQKLYGTSEFDIGKDLSTEGAQQLLSELSGQRGELARATQAAIAAGEDVDLKALSGRLSEPTLNALSSQRITREQTLASGLDIAISDAGTLPELSALKGSEGLRKDQLNRISVKENSIRVAAVKERSAARKLLEESQELPTGAADAMQKFDAASVGLKHTMAQAFDSLDGDDRTALNIFKQEVDAYDDTYKVTRKDGEKLSNLARAFVGSLSEDGKIDLAQTVLGGKPGNNGENISNKLISEIKALITNSVDLTPAQWDAYDRALLGQK